MTMRKRYDTGGWELDDTGGWESEAAEKVSFQAPPLACIITIRGSIRN